MGRWSTGAITAGEAIRLNISTLVKRGYLIKGAYTDGTISWTSGASIAIRCYYSPQHRYAELGYSYGQEELTYRIQIETIPSNLGAGEVPFFICPQTGARVRVLYLAYGSRTFKSRQAYRRRIYYPGQLCSKYERPLTRYWELDKKLQKLGQLRRQQSYAGQTTRREERRLRLQAEQADAERERFNPSNMPISLREAIKEVLLDMQDNNG